MAELPAIETYILESHPDGRSDAYRWRVWLEESVPLWVELSGPQANETQLDLPELHQRLPQALRRYANARLRADTARARAGGGLGRRRARGRALRHRLKHPLVWVVPRVRSSWTPSTSRPAHLF